MFVLASSENCVGIEDESAKIKLLIEKFLSLTKIERQNKVVSYPMLGHQSTYTADITRLGFKFIGLAILRFIMGNASSERILESLKFDELPDGYRIASYEDTYREDAIRVIHEAFKDTQDALYDTRYKSIDGTRDIINKVVDSIYGEGSTFQVNIRQRISDPLEVGDLTIHNYSEAKRREHESIFTATDAAVLIVDDNEMNLEVEKSLLLGTKMHIDTAKSGREALKKTLERSYDAILMDHLMPQMDGIECLDQIKNQQGGLNVNTPIIALTANAGSDAKKLYASVGFDGYLIKPVSGAALEEMLASKISSDKLSIKGTDRKLGQEINMTGGYISKLPVVITSNTVCDLPDYMIRDLRLPLISFMIQTEDGEFKDGVQMDSDEMLNYLKSGRTADSKPPYIGEYIDFFASVLKTAHNIIYIAISSSMSEDYDRAKEAAASFDNVSVVCSEGVSSSTGLLVLIAYKLMQQGFPVESIVAELESVKSRIRTSFVIDTTQYLLKKGLISARDRKSVV